MAKGNDLAIAYVQLLPSFDKFFSKASSDLTAKASEFKKYGAQAGAQWAQGFAANAKTTTSTTATSTGGGGSGASGAATVAAAGLGAEVGSELGAIEAAAGAAGLRVSTNFAQGLTRGGAALSAAGTALTTGVTVPLVAVGALATTSAVQFESAFAGVRKTVTATEEEFANLETGIRNLAKEIPATREEIAKVTELGGQFGVPNENLLEFTRTVVDLGVATNLSSEEGALLLAQFANITGLPTDEFDNLGSTIVDLGNNLSTTEDRIAQFALRLGGQGSIIGLTQDQILGFSAALASVGIMPEAGGTAFSRVFQRISDAVETGNEDLQAFADTTGLTVDQFEELYKSDPSALINEFVKGLSNVAASGATTPLLDELELVDVRIRDSLQRLAGSEDILGKALGISSSAWEQNIALTTEAERRYATTESQLQIFQNRIGDIGVTLGDALLPAINKLLESLEPIGKAVANVAEFFSALPEPVQQTALAVGVMAAVSGPLAAGLGRVVTGLGGVALNSATAGAGLARFSAQAAAASAQANATGASVNKMGSNLALGRVAGSLTVFTGIIAGLDALSGPLNNVLGLTEDLAKAQSDLQKTLGSGETTLDAFQQFFKADPASLNPITTAVGLLQEGLRGGTVLNETAVSYRDIDRAVREVGKNGTDALSALKADLIAQQREVQVGTEEWEGYAYAIRQVNAELGLELPPGSLGEGIGRGIAAEQEANRRSLENADGALRNYAASAAPAVESTEGFAVALAKVQAQGKFASAGIDAAAAAADRYRTAIENAGTDDNVLAAALRSAAGFRGLLEGGGFKDSEAERQGQARKIAAEQDRIATEMRDSATSTEAFDDALQRLNPQLAILEANASSAAAAGAAFRQSIEDSSSLDDVTESTVSLGEAYRGMRRSIRALPADLDLVAVSMGKVRGRQQRAVESILALGEATKDYLGTLIDSGKSNQFVISEADRLRQAYIDQFRQVGFNEEQIRKYLETMGLTPDQVATAIKVSGIEEARSKLEAYASLLEGKIPGSVAASVIASVESGDFEGAASQLARFAATNPIDIPLTVSVDQPAITAAQDALEELERVTLALPEAYDAVGIALGDVTEDQERGLGALISQGDAAQDVIAELIAKGAQTGDLGFTEAREAADRFRAKFRDILAQYGIVGGAAETYIDDLLQLDEVDVENSIRLAGIDEALTQITLYQDLLKAIGVGLPAEVGKLIAENMRDKNYAGVAEILKQFTEGELGLTPEPVTIPVEVDPAVAAAQVEEFDRKTEEETLVVIPIEANDEPARGKAWKLATDIGLLAPIFTINVDDTRARQLLGKLIQDFPIFGITSPDAPSGGTLPGLGGAGGRDGNIYTPFMDGGYVSGPGTGTSDSIAARLSNGEYVMTAATVRSLGVGFLDKLNKGYTPGFAMGGLVSDTPAPAVATGGVNVDYTVVETKTHPRPEDLVRVIDSAQFMAAAR